MSNVHAFALDQSKPSDVPAAYLGPAEITELGPLVVTVTLKNSARVQARIAVAFSYQPSRGDQVLVIGNDEGHYVIGVLFAQAAAKMMYPGDVDIVAGGKLRLRGEDGVALEGSSVKVQAGKLEIMARAATQRFEQLRQRVTDMLSLQAGKTHTVVDGSSYTRAKSSTLLTEEKVSINGKAIHLG